MYLGLWTWRGSGPLLAKSSKSGQILSKLDDFWMSILVCQKVDQKVDHFCYYIVVDKIDPFWTHIWSHFMTHLGVIPGPRFRSLLNSLRGHSRLCPVWAPSGPGLNRGQNWTHLGTLFWTPFWAISAITICYKCSTTFGPDTGNPWIWGPGIPDHAHARKYIVGYRIP